MKKLSLFLIILLSGCSVKYKTVVKIENKEIKPIKITKKEQKKIKKLYLMLLNLDKTVDKKEAYSLSKIAILYPIHLAKKYCLVYPPNFHNFLVNINLRKKGLCYQWVEDMMNFIRCKKFKTLVFHWGVANRGKLNEHNVIVVTAKNKPFKSGIILDAWRNSGNLYFNYLKEEKKYKFMEWKQKSKIISSSYGCIP